MHIDKLYKKVNQYNDTYHRTIKMKPVDVNLSMHIDFNKENNKECPKFKVDDPVRISKYKNIFAKTMFQIGLKKFLWLKKFEKLCHGHILFVMLVEMKLLESFTKKNHEKQIEKS